MMKTGLKVPFFNTVQRMCATLHQHVDDAEENTFQVTPMLGMHRRFQFIVYVLNFIPPIITLSCPKKNKNARCQGLSSVYGACGMH